MTLEKHVSYNYWATLFLCFFILFFSLEKLCATNIDRMQYTLNDPATKRWYGQDATVATNQTHRVCTLVVHCYILVWVFYEMRDLPYLMGRSTAA